MSAASGALAITLTPDPSPEDVWAITRGLVRWNDAHAELENWARLTLLLRDAEGALCGGLDGNTHWRWLFVRQLWVDPRYHRLGYGTALVEAAEAEARRRGCASAHLDTFDFQALPLYRRLGYTVFAELDNFPEGHSRYFLVKRVL